MCKSYFPPSLRLVLGVPVHVSPIPKSGYSQLLLPTLTYLHVLRDWRGRRRPKICVGISVVVIVEVKPLKYPLFFFLIRGLEICGIGDGDMMWVLA